MFFYTVPQLDGSSILLVSVDAAGWSLLRREPVLLVTCVSNAMAIGELVVSIVDLGEDHHRDLRSTWVACSILSAANTYLWLQYARDEEYADKATRIKAASYFEAIRLLVSSWTQGWRMVRSWLTAL